MDKAAPPTHVLIFPFAAQGHINPMLKLAELLCLAGFHVTFLTTASIHSRLLQHSDIKSRFPGYFRLQSIPDGLPDGSSRGYFGLMDTFDLLRVEGKPLLKQILVSRDKAPGPVTCVISDGILSSALEVCEETGVPVFYFRTSSACSFWAYSCIPDLIRAGELPFDSNDLDVPIINVRGMEGMLRRRDLPSFCRASDLNTREVQHVIYETNQTPRARGLILNTFEDLEGTALDQIRTEVPNLYSIGPLHAHLRSRLEAASLNHSSSSNSLWKEDRSCMKWLDEQPSKSVIYISFGSYATVARDKHMEIWHGLVNSGKRFLWVIRPDSVEEKGEVPEEVLEGTKDRGCIVGWAPQEEVLAHPAVGGFLTHCGWNSTLESIVAGVPMICWPYFADQQINSRFISEIWKLGVDMKDTCSRVIVERMVRDVMEGSRKDGFLESAQNMANSAKQSISKLGTSYFNLDRLIEDIRAIAVQSGG